MILIQISDLHITDPGEPVDRLARTTERLAKTTHAYLC